MNSTKTLALVARGPASNGQWKLESVVPRPLKANELIIRIVASGICLADVHFGNTDEDASNPAIWYPRVLGHEGSGYVEQVGCAVTVAKPGDPVLLSYMSCGQCYNCQDSHPAYCTEVFNCNFHGERGIYAPKHSQDFNIGGSFFGQSSFTSRAIVQERTVVNLKSVGVSEQELQIFAPLGCGVQTGSGAFVNIADVQAKDEVAVLGVGGVGQSAIMAAAMRKCKTIIAIDRSQSRLQQAKDLGATHTINTSDTSLNLVSEVLRITGGRGVHVSLDTTGVQALARQSWDFVRCHGKILQVGLANPGDIWDVSMADHMNSGKQIIGCVQGDSIPQKYALEMIKWYREGNFPIDKIMKLYPADEHQQALEDMRVGATIKPVLLWSNPRPSRI